MHRLTSPFFRAGLIAVTLQACAARDSQLRITENDAQASLEANKAVARRFFTEVWGGGSEFVAKELLAPTYLGHMNGAAQPLDRDGWLAFFRQFRQAFPDAAFTIEDMIAEEDRVVLRLTMRGTHRGPFSGIPATGRAVVVTGVSIERVAEGKIVEGWVTTDVFGMLTQLGAIPAPPPT
jgi:steroid delta-isomerase-like uncharacterized protein